MSDFERPFPLQFHGSALARWMLTLFGWKVEFDGLPVSQGVIVVYPHTSNWDFIAMILAPGGGRTNGTATAGKT